MGTISRRLRFSLAVMLLWASAAQAQTVNHSVYLDLDRNAGSGCSVVTAAGTVAGAEARVVATVTGTQVTAVVRETCSGGVFGSAQAQPSGYPVGLNVGLGGSDAIEFSTNVSGLPVSGSANLTFASDTATGADLVTTITGVSLPGVIVNNPTVIPATGLIGLLLLIGLMLWLVRRHPKFGSSMGLLLLFGAGVVWAANFVMDGQFGDWAGVSPRAIDASNDSTSGEGAIDIVAVYAEGEAGRLFLRVDLRDAETQAPTITSANAATFTVGVAGTFTVNSTGVPPAALSIGCTPVLPPSVTFTDNGNGTATLAGTPATGTANTYACTVTANNGIAPNATQAFTLTIARANTTTALTSAPNPSSLGQTVTFTATVTTTSTLTPAGSVSFMDGAVVLGTATLNGSGVATLTTTTLTPGTHPVSAVYAGNVDFNGSTSATVNQVVDPAPTTTTLAATPNPSVFGQAVTLTATINETAPGTPTGTVTFFDGAANLGTATLVAGVASVPTSALSTGSHNLTAVYAGDANFAGSTSNTVVQVVNQAATSTALVSSVNPSVFGQPVTFTATVSISAPGAGTPAGTVTFTDGAATLGTVALSGGRASLTPGTLTLGTHPITATFNGTADLAGSSSTPLNQVVNQAASTTALTSDTNPSIVSQSVTFTATVSAVAPGAGTPTGTVTFLDGVTPLVTVALDGSGVATFTTSTLTQGTHPITAAYNGSANFATSTSTPVNQVVTLAGSATALTSSVNPTVFGQPTTFTATVTAVPPAVGTPTGTVTFTDGASLNVTVALNGSGIATLTTSTLAVGTHPITATYNGDATFGTSASTPLNQIVNQGATTTTLVSDINPSAVGQSVTFTATVSVDAPASGTPTGTVTFFDGAINLGTVTLAAGQASLSVNSLTAGPHAITTNYAGDTNFATSTSAALTQTVNAASTTTLLSAVPNPSVFGQSVTFTAAVSVGAPGAGTPTGVVTFFDGVINLGTDTLDGSGVATLTVMSLAVATHPITAQYATDGNYASSTSNPVNQVVNTAGTTTTLTSDVNPSVVGQNVTFTATVGAVPPGTGTPTGTVNFLDGVTPIGSGTLDGTGVATLSTNALSSGVHSITAVYAGDGSYATSTSNVVSQNVDGPPAVTTVAPLNGATQVPTNATLTVNFNENVDIALGGVTLDCGGAVALTGLPANNVNTVTLTPSAPLPAGTPCTATVLAAGVTDDDAIDPPDNLAADFVWSFTTDQAPSVTTTTPTNGAVDQSSSTDLTVTFSEPVTAVAGSFTLSCTTSGAHSFVLSGGTTTYTLNPDTDFAAGETCTATVLAMGVTDVDVSDPPDNMAANYVWSFTLDQAPSVLTTAPTNGAIGIAGDSDIDLTFNESVNFGTSSATISCATSGAHAYTTGGGPSAAFTLDPTTDFAANELCTVTVLAAQVTDADGNDPPDNMAANFVFAFTTDAAPSVIATTPINGAVGAPDANVSITFSEPVDATGSSFTVNCTVSGAHTYVLGGNPTTYTLNLNTDFTAGETCTVTVVAAQVSDQDAGDPPDNMLADVVFSFTIDGAPSVLTTTPTNGAVDTSTGIAIQVAYDEPVTAGGTAYALECPLGTPRTFVLSGNGTATHTLTPTVALPSGTTCTVTVTATQITDVDANDPPDQMGANYVFSFSTDAVPSVTATTPTNGATGVAGNANIDLTFSESVNFTTGSATISCATSGAHAFTIGASPSTTFTLNPSVDFASGELCTVTVLAAQVADADGNDPPDNMAANFVFSFTIDAAPSVTATTPTNGATQVASNASIGLTFSESVNFTTGSATISCVTSGAHVFAIGASPSATFTLDPTVDFVSGEVCTVTLLAAQVTDADNNDPPDNMAANFVFSFTIDQAPAVTTTTPTNGATGIAPNATITVNFSESVNATTSSFTIQCPAASANLGYTLSASPAASFTLTPSANLPAGTICTVTVIAAQITDTDAGDPPDNMLANFVFSFSVPPVAVNDTYAPSIVGNVGVNTATSSGFTVLSNDTPNSGITPALVAGSITPAGGSVTFTAAGTFTYLPPPGYEGAASFQYTLTNAAGTSNAATVSLTIGGMIWFVAPNGAAGDGRIGTPFNSLAAFQAVNDGSTALRPSAGDNIFLFEAGPSFTGPVRLLNNQRLIGQDANQPLATVSGITPPLDTIPFPVTNAANGAIADITAAAGTNAIEVINGASNIIRGLQIANVTATGTGIGMSPTPVPQTSFGTLTIGTAAPSDVLINTNGRAINLQGGTLAARFASLTSAGSSQQGINLLTVAGTLNVDAGAITDSTGTDILIDGSNADVTYAGTITDDLGQLINVTNTTGGTKTFSGAITDGNDGDGSGISLTSNTGGTITFSGGLLLSTGANPAFVATGGGTVTSSNAVVNTLTTTTATALNVTNTTIGGSGLTFRSISSNGGSAAGIVLNNTGTTGGLTVTGTGSAGSGGTIANKSGGNAWVFGGGTPVLNGATVGVGVYMNSTRGTSLSWMQLNDFTNAAISGFATSTFAMSNTVINGSNGNDTAEDESAVFFYNLNSASGSDSTITNCSISGGFEENLHVLNQSGSLDRLVITGTTFGFNNTANGNNSLLIESQNAGTILNFTLQSSTVRGARADWINASNNSSSTMDAVIGGSTGALGNTFDALGANNHPGAAAGGNRVVMGAIGVQTVDIRNNVIRGSRGEAIRIRSTGTASGLTGTVDARVRNNVIGIAGTANSGSAESSGIHAFGDGGSDMDIAITNNQVFQYNNHGILMTFGDEINPGSVFNATVTGNTVNTPGTNNNDFNALHLNSGTVGATDDFTSCVDVGGAGVGNNVANGGDGGVFPNNADLRLRQRQSTTVRLPGYVGPVRDNGDNEVAEVSAYLAGRNTLATVAGNSVSTGGGYVGGAACTQPSIP